MKRTKRCRRTAKRARMVGRATPLSSCRALIPLKTDRIRIKDLKKFERGKRAFAELEALHDRFEKIERRAYTQWVRKHCGTLMEDIRESSEQCRLLVTTMQLASDLKNFYHMKSGRDCVLAAERYYAEGKPPPGFESFFAPDPDPPELDPPSGFDDESDDDGFKTFFEDETLFGSAEYRDLEEMMHDFLGLPMPPPRGPEQKQSLKEVYRKIARRLHPDQGGSGEKRQMELWYEAQEAYAHHDLETLERILAHCDLLDDDTARAAPVSSIRAGIVFFKQACTRLRRKIRQFKMEPEWGFLSWSENRKNIEREAHMQALRRELKRVRSDLTLWRKMRDRQVKEKTSVPHRPNPKNRTVRVNLRQMAFDL